jgi:D-beta-D-heptose 7-phosphate kinase/D-beta-D-heptose 1-phosphate adenosyltransferase
MKPKTIVKGGDYTAETVVGSEFCDSVEIFKYMEGKSTTKIIEQVLGLKVPGQINV